MSRVQRAACYLAPIALCLAVYWRAPFTWFRLDDFAWLSLPRLIHSWSDLQLLVIPKAEGTIRIFSERLYFWVLAGVFGIRASVFHAVGLGVWFVDLALLQAIGARLTRSPAAGLLAALLWTVSAGIATPLDWASCFNQVLCALCVLGAFYSRLRWLESGESKWRWREAVAYLAGFGVLETIVMYPAMVLLYAAVDAEARRRWKSAVWIFLPAAAFMSAHLFLIPRVPDSVYTLAVDSRMPATFLRYLAWTLGPSETYLLPPGWGAAGMAATCAIGVALASYLIFRIVRGERVVLFFAGWFLLWIAPVLPLANHRTDYYITIPGIGLAWLASAALVSAWRSGAAMRAVAVILASAYFVGSVMEVQSVTSFHLRMGSNMRRMYRAAEAVVAAHPEVARAGGGVAWQGVDYELFRGGFRDHPSLLLGVERTWLVPGSDAVLDRPEFGDVKRFRTTPEELLALVDGGQVRVIGMGGDEPTDATRVYRQVLTAQLSGSRRNGVSTGNPADASRLGEGWFEIENGARWIGKRASVVLAGPRNAAEKLQVEGYVPAAALAAGALRVSVLVAGRVVGAVMLTEKDQPFSIQAEAPKELVGAYSMEVGLECGRTFRPVGDVRELGVVIGKIEVR